MPRCFAGVQLRGGMVLASVRHVREVQQICKVRHDAQYDKVFRHAVGWLRGFERAVVTGGSRSGPGKPDALRGRERLPPPKAERVVEVALKRAGQTELQARGGQPEVQLGWRGVGVGVVEGLCLVGARVGQEVERGFVVMADVYAADCGTGGEAGRCGGGRSDCGQLCHGHAVRAGGGDVQRVAEVLVPELGGGAVWGGRIA
ncbi:hypothetical protein FGB62_24g027 [Gracilaria domingensis]|nr:hypothetical protein FGB62_24g027 [Gracilaria domingensis]